MSFGKVLFTGFAPNLRTSDILKIFEYIFYPLRWLSWRKGDKTVQIEKVLSNYLGVNDVISFDSGRSGLFAALRTLGVGDGDEVLLQAYTCVVVPNSIKFTGAKPIYVDIDSDFNMDPDDLMKKITDKSKVLIIQHTFGNPAQMAKLVPIARDRGLKIIEDCAHSLGGEYDGKKLGTYGDLAMLSFGTDKIISCVRGGAIATNDEQLSKKIREYRNSLPQIRFIRLWQHLNHYLLFAFSKPLYGFYFGKIILALAKKFYIMARVITGGEKEGKVDKNFPSQMPNILADILLGQVKHIDMANRHREKIARVYNEILADTNLRLPRMNSTNYHSVFLRYTILVNNPTELAAKMKRFENVILGDWYRTVIAPSDVDISKSGYIPGSCPGAEKYALQSINLPTNITIKEKEAVRIARAVKKFL